MEFLEVTAEDTESIKEIIFIEEEAFGKNGGVDEWILKPLVRYGKVFVLKSDEKIVSIGEFMGKFDSDEVFLYGLCTRKESRGRGYAVEMMRRSEAYFSRRGMNKLGLTVDPSNEVAIGLYRKLGYDIGELQKDEYGKGVDRLFMWKKI